jgi:hypothetical protein
MIYSRSIIEHDYDEAVFLSLVFVRFYEDLSKMPLGKHQVWCMFISQVEC